MSYTTDAVALEENVEQMLTGMISTSEGAALRARLEQHQEETRRQAERLRECLSAHGERHSAAKSMEGRRRRQGAPGRRPRGQGGAERP